MPSAVRMLRRNTLDPEREYRQHLCELGSDAVPAGVASPLRTFLNRQNLHAGAPLPPTTAVTSALPGEHTALVAHALSAVLARDYGRRVCRIDGEWLRTDHPSDSASAHRLADIVDDQTKLSNALTSPHGEPLVATLRLEYATADDPSSAVRSTDVHSLLQLLHDRFDHVIVEAPGLLVYDGSPVVLHESQGYLLVVRKGASSEGNVRTANSLGSPTECLAAMLVDFDRRRRRVLRRRRFAR